jgi:hypothetical protein
MPWVAMPTEMPAIIPRPAAYPDPLGSEALLQAGGGAEHAAVHAHVLAEHDDPLVVAISWASAMVTASISVTMGISAGLPVREAPRLLALFAQTLGQLREQVVEHGLPARAAC